MDNLDIKSFFGQIIKVNKSGGGFPSIGNTTYDVQFVYNNQVFTYQNIVPNNQRPVKINTIEIIPAKVGDICGVYWADNKVSFFITEGLEVEDCSLENPLTNLTPNDLTADQLQQIRTDRLVGFITTLPRSQSILQRRMIAQNALDAQRAAQ